MQRTYQILLLSYEIFYKNIFLSKNYNGQRSRENSRKVEAKKKKKRNPKKETKVQNKKKVKERK